MQKVKQPRPNKSKHQVISTLGRYTVWTALRNSNGLRVNNNFSTINASKIRQNDARFVKEPRIIGSRLSPKAISPANGITSRSKLNAQIAIRSPRFPFTLRRGVRFIAATALLKTAQDRTATAIVSLLHEHSAAFRGRLLPVSKSHASPAPYRLRQIKYILRDT